MRVFLEVGSFLVRFEVKPVVHLTGFFLASAVFAYFRDIVESSRL